MSKAPAPAAPRKRQLRIASGCATRDSFITVFRRFCDRSSIFIATKTPKPIGEELAFTMTLADGTPLITGTGRVISSYTDDKGTYGRPGMKIQFGELDSASSRLVDELVATARAKPATLPPPRPPTPSRSIPAVPPIKPLPSVVAAARSKPPTPPVVPGPVPSPSGVEPKLGSTLMLTPVRRKEEEDVVVVAPPPPAAAEKPAGGANWDDASEFGGPTRVRGGKSVLPANPLGSLEPDSIEAFVECTLYEDTGGFGEGEPTSPNFPDDPVSDMRRAGTTLPPFYAGPIPAEMDIVDSMKVPAKMLRAALDTPPQQPAVNVDGSPASAPRAASAAERAVSAAAAAAAPAAEPIDRTEDILLPRATRSHWPLTAGIAGAAALLGVLAGYLLGSGSARESARAEPASAAPVAAVTPPTSPDPPSAAAPAALAAAPDTAEPAALTTLAGELGPDRCGLAVDSQPEGAEVSIGDQLAGQTPLRLELPCRSHEVVVRRVRYSDATRTVELHPGRMESLRVDLARPEHRLRIVSTPKGARVSVSGRDEGSAPAVAIVSGYEQVTVRVQMDGYRPWSKKVYARKATTTVSARLERIPTPAAKPVVAKPTVAKPAARKAPATAPRKTP